MDKLWVRFYLNKKLILKYDYYNEGGIQERYATRALLAHEKGVKPDEITIKITRR